MLRKHIAAITATEFEVVLGVQSLMRELGPDQQPGPLGVVLLTTDDGRRFVIDEYIEIGYVG